MKKHGLKKLAEEILNIKQTHIEELIGEKKKGQKQKNIREVSIEQLKHYACQDVDITLRLKEHFEPILKAKGLEKVFYEIEMPLIYVLAEMEYEGVRIDTEFLQQLLLQIDNEINDLEKNMFSMVGKSINFNSPAQLSNLLFDELNIEPIGSRLKSGKYSTGKTVLQKLKTAHSIIPKLLKYREAVKLKSTFIEKLPKYISPISGRLHTNFNQTVTATGRLSSSKPNLQNIPKKKEGIGNIIRRAFISRNDNYVLIAADFSQIELRIMAHFSQDPALLYAYINKIDIHIATAARMYNVPVEQIGEDDSRRGEAKSINFGLIYGMSPIGLAEKLTELLKREVTEFEAREKTETYFELFKGVKAFIEEAIYKATCNGYAETLTGRKRYLAPSIDSNIRSKRAAMQRNSVNMPIQGTAADLIKISMINIQQEIKKRGLQSRMILQIHDELVFDVPKQEQEIMTELIKQKMESAMTLTIPLLVEIKFGRNWRDGLKLKIHEKQR